MSVQGQELDSLILEDSFQHRIVHDLVGDDKEKGVAELIPWWQGVQPPREQQELQHQFCHLKLIAEQ